MIRKISVADLTKIYTLGTLYDINFCNLYNLENYINNDLYILNAYEENGILKGFIIANKIYENIEVLLVYVKDEFRKCGIATKLLLDLETFNVDNVLLEVSVLNIPALELYKKCGFTIINTRKKYYKGIDAYVMKKVLK